MRALLEIELDTPTANRAVADGAIMARFNQIMADLKPEAAYAFPRNGRRCQIVVVDVADEAAVVAICEPFWLEFNAHIDMHVCMNADDLRVGLGRVGR
ncbi:hypothetical protein [Kitasatospora purpeofusca]|uniref:hypothetical protein n=1 Tax=Kitasatospora purpeofusca TaxID=67352 RepID=UPI00224F3B99|nr:hypothetical protein [Kitasatospora purpeofusca]MCX4756699.1 hypothetical protein [Kitasatospora purpeofusca]WSR35509.1 hypothetical protein OG715_33840 [Kitasatospora purpeofusca]WSR43828.1 hypothetical protein OG196_34880 [Kitasatospora purpeofusca]